MAEITIIAKNNSIVVNGLQCEKGRLSIAVSDDTILVNNLNGNLSEVTINGNSYGTMQEFVDAADELLFENGGGAPVEGVQSVTGDLVSGTATNPIVNLPSDILRTEDTSIMPVSGKVPMFSPQGLLSTGTPQFPENAVPLSYLDALLLGKQDISEKDQAGGYPSLDSSGKIPLEFLNISSLTFKGSWDASTNTPELLNGEGDVGDFHKVSVGGTYNFGNGEHTFTEGDWVMFAAGVWQRIGVHETVQSVNGKIGTVVINKSDVGLGNADNTSDANKPVSTAQQQALNQKQDTLVSGTNIKTVAGQSLMGVGNVDLPGVSPLISSTVQDGLTINEYADRIEYLAKIQAPNQNLGTGGDRYGTYTSTVRLPVGVSISGADWAEISIKNSNRSLDVCVYDNTSRYIALGYFNNYSNVSSITANPTVFIKLTNYK